MAGPRSLASTLVRSHHSSTASEYLKPACGAIVARRNFGRNRTSGILHHSLCTSVLHCNRAQATLQQSPQEERQGTSDKDTTPREETTTSTSHLGSQCRPNTGALQRQYHYDRCTSCDQEDDDIKEEEDILVTCLHIYDVDIKEGECYMLNLPQPYLPTLTVFDGTTPTFPEWARELRAYLNISLSTSTSWTSPTMRSNLLQHTSWGVQQTPARHRQHQDIARLTRALQDLRDERAQSADAAACRANADIDHAINQTNNELNAQPLLQDATTARVRRAGELLGCLILHATKPSETKQPTMSTKANKYRLGDMDVSTA